MKAAAWFMCWPLLGVLWFSATGADLLSDASEALDGVIGQLMDYAESEE